MTFDDVAGVDEAKAELQEIVDFLKNPKELRPARRAHPEGRPAGRPAGTGKTLLARAVAGEAGVPFFSISGSEFVEMFVGVGAARVRDLFEQARAKRAGIIFIDELDALGRARGAFPGFGGHDEKEQTLNQLLVELDGFDPSVGVVLLAATNRPEILDPALLRAGRFDRQVLVDRPDRKGRAGDPAGARARRSRSRPASISSRSPALTPGFTGADLANLVNEAALVATRRGADAVTLADFTHGDRAHRRRPREEEPPAQPERARGRRLPRDGPRAGGAGAAGQRPGAQGLDHPARHRRARLHDPAPDRGPLPDDARSELEHKMAVLLGGRAAEQLVFGELSTGAADDLAKATDIARSMVTRYGMDEGLGHVSYAEGPPRLLDVPGAPAWNGSTDQSRHRRSASTPRCSASCRRASTWRPAC